MTKAPRLITNEELKKACKEYYKAGKLTMQTSKYCRFQDGDYRCAIGAALTEEEVEKAGLLGAATVDDLQELDVVKFEDVNFARRLQRAHDARCLQSRAHDKVEELIGLEIEA